jgi:hypothetical protein
MATAVAPAKLVPEKAKGLTPPPALGSFAPYKAAQTKLAEHRGKLAELTAKLKQLETAAGAVVGKDALLRAASELIAGRLDLNAVGGKTAEARNEIAAVKEQISIVAASIEILESKLKDLVRPASEQIARTLAPGFFFHAQRMARSYAALAKDATELGAWFQAFRERGALMCKPLDMAMQASLAISGAIEDHNSAVCQYLIELARIGAIAGNEEWLDFGPLFEKNVRPYLDKAALEAERLGRGMHCED